MSEGYARMMGVIQVISRSIPEVKTIMTRTIRYVPMLLVVLTLAAACGGTAEPTPTAPAPTAAVAEEAAPTEVVVAEETPLQEPTAEPSPEETAAPGTDEPVSITVEQLRNATYSSIYDEPVALTDGLYEEDMLTVEYAEGAELYGDLDGDGVEDAVVFLLERGGGTGSFTYIAAQLNQDGQPVDAGAVWMDEVSVRSAAIEDGKVVMELIVIGPGDADCCGSHKAARTYALQEGQLVEVSGQEEDLEQISAADLDGTNWTLLELDYDQPAAADAEVTISFQEDQIAGFGGCNDYNSSFSLGEENPFAMTVSPVAATQKSCPDPTGSQESAYVAALEQVSGWGYSFGRLALYYYVEDQAGLSRLLFAPETEAGSVEAETLTGQTWQWVSFTDPLEAYEVESPESYTLTFNEDGTVAIVADCNNASGSYTDEDGALTIEIGPMTVAACAPDSRSDEYVGLLGSAARYFFEQGFFYIDLFADGGTMAFAVPGEAESAGDVTSYPWLWTSFTSPVEQFEVETPENYVVIFNDDGTVNIKADCNSASGSYTVDGSSLAIEVGPMTLAACPPDSRSDQFIQDLGFAARYSFEDGFLYIDLMADGGTMAFSPALDAEQFPSEAEDAASGTLPEDIVGQLDAYLQSQVYAEGGNPELAAPGLVLLVDTPDGRCLSAAGVSSLEDGTPMQVDDILQIGSNTKSMVIVLLMQLVEEGVLNLDDLLSEWLPEQAAIVPNSDQITIHQMARHTAGIHDYEEGIITQGLSDPAKLQAGYTPAEIVQFAMDDGEPVFSPGEEGQWQYSNTGYILLGMIIEAATGESLSDLLQSRIFDPLGLESAVLIEGVPQEGEITTKGYKWTEEGERLDTTNWNAIPGLGRRIGGDDG